MKSNFHLFWGDSSGQWINHYNSQAWSTHGWWYWKICWGINWTKFQCLGPWLVSWHQSWNLMFDADRYFAHALLRLLFMRAMKIQSLWKGILSISYTFHTKIYLVTRTKSASDQPQKYFVKITYIFVGVWLTVANFDKQNIYITLELLKL